MPERAEISHKGTFGRILNVSGSDYMPGAAYLSSLAALTVGCGYVFLCSTERVINAIAAQTQNVVFWTIVTRNLRANQGAYEYLDKVKSTLTGFQVDECTKLMPTKDFFISENGGIWQYGINFALNTTNIQDF